MRSTSRRGQPQPDVPRRLSGSTAARSPRSWYATGRERRRYSSAVSRRGGRVVEVSADEHDRIAAVTQALTHAAVLAFGLALDELGVAVDDLGSVATPPHLTFAGPLDRITSGTAETYCIVQAGNPHARRARTALAAGLATLAETCRTTARAPTSPPSWTGTQQARPGLRRVQPHLRGAFRRRSSPGTQTSTALPGT